MSFNEDHMGILWLTDPVVLIATFKIIPEIDWRKPPYDHMLKKSQYGCFEKIFVLSGLAQSTL